MFRSFDSTRACEVGSSSVNSLCLALLLAPPHAVLKRRSRPAGGCNDAGSGENFRGPDELPRNGREAVQVYAIRGARRSSIQRLPGSKACYGRRPTFVIFLERNHLPGFPLARAVLAGVRIVKKFILDPSLLGWWGGTEGGSDGFSTAEAALPTVARVELFTR